MNPQAGVIFDMDGVLVDSAAAHFESWQRLAQELGAPRITHEEFQGLFGRRSAEIIQAWFGVSDPQDARRHDNRKESIYRDLIRDDVPAMPGAVTLVTALHEARISLAVGSSGPPENVQLVCRELGIDRFLGAIVTGNDVQRGKPDPQVFQIAAERLGVQPRACVVVEDAPSGIEAARRAGMKCIALAGSHPRASLRGADLCVDRLDELSSARILELLLA